MVAIVGVVEIVKEISRIQICITFPGRGLIESVRRFFIYFNHILFGGNMLKIVELKSFYFKSHFMRN